MTSPPFRYGRPTDVAGALALGRRADAAYLAGGTDLLQLWKTAIASPAEVVDISRLPLSRIDVSPDQLVIGATARLSDVAADAGVARDHPLSVQAILASASGQLRNMATVGGNLLQRTRCPDFRDEALPCNKRAPGSGCGALHGETRQAALFGASGSCVATHPSDLAVALVALDARVEIAGEGGARIIDIADLHRLPGDTPDRDTTLPPGDLITAVRVEGGSRFAARSHYLKVRDRASFEFAIVSVAAGLRVQDGVVVEARLVAGGVAPKPWRLVASEAALVGRPATSETFATAAALAGEGARPVGENGFKVGLLCNAVRRALEATEPKL